MNRNFITISNPFSDTKTPVILNSSICRGCPYKVTPCQHIKKKPPSDNMLKRKSPSDDN